MKRKIKTSTRVTKKRIPQFEKLEGIGGWLIVILALFMLSVFSSATILSEKLGILFHIELRSGVVISAVLLVVYLVFLLRSIYFLLSERKIAIRNSITAMKIGIVFSLWYYLIGVLIFYPETARARISYNLLFLVLDIVIMGLIIAYFRKSSRVKNTLIR